MAAGPTGDGELRGEADVVLGGHLAAGVGEGERVVGQLVQEGPEAEDVHPVVVHLRGEGGGVERVVEIFCTSRK